MNADQHRRAFQFLIGYLHHDWVELPLVVSCANEAVGFDAYDIVTPESREFVTMLVGEEKVIVGSLHSDAGFIAWTGLKKDNLQRVLDQMPIGASMRNEQLVWFDLPERRETK